MKNKNFLFIPDSYLTSNTESFPIFPRKAIYSLEQAPGEELPPGDVPAQPAPSTPDVLLPEVPEEQPDAVGYLEVSVFTASGALPVQDAVVTVYIMNENNQENAISHLVTDANGQVPTIALPVYYDRFNPLESSEYYFTTYNLRVQAINYYTINILGFRVFPNTTTSFTIELIPAAIGPTEGPGTTFVIPPSPIDLSND